MKSVSLDYWRNYFRTANCDIFGIIDHAIMVAASDCPKEFKLRRDRIAERLFCCRLPRCSGCNHVSIGLPAHEGETDDLDDDHDDDGDDKDNDIDVCEVEGGGTSKESNDQLLSNYSYVEAEALTDEIEEESMVVGEVLRIKDVLLSSREESDSVLLESLRRLQLMALTVDTLKVTEIGKAVNSLRRHGLKQIRQLARVLIDEWKELVDEWYSNTKVIRDDEGTPESVNPPVVDEEEGLPSPPLDEAFFFATQAPGIELSRFFDGMDDDGNPQDSGGFIKNRENERKSSFEHQNTAKRKEQATLEVNVCNENNKSGQIRRQEAMLKPKKPLTSVSGSGRPPKQGTDRQTNHELNIQLRKDELLSQRKPPGGLQDKFKYSDENAVRVKLEATKRKLQERYQQAENAKRNRTIQVMELHDLPKQASAQRNPSTRPGSHNRHWAHARRQHA